MLGLLGDFLIAKNEILYAIKLYSFNNMQFGVAVSGLNLSKVYSLEKKYDSALYYANLSLAYWGTTTDSFRILTVKNQLIHIGTKTDELVWARKVQEEAETLLNAEKLSWVVIIDYYYVSMELYEKLQMQSIQNKYIRLYEEKIHEVKENEKIDASSEYARNSE